MVNKDCTFCIKIVTSSDLFEEETKNIKDMSKYTL